MTDQIRPFLDDPVPWPGGARCAVSISFDMDSDAFLHPMHPDRAHTYQALISWLRYDEIALPRIVRLFEDYEIKQTLFVPGWCIERYPHAVAAIVEGGHEIAHHGYLHENPMAQTRESELYWLERAAAVIADFTGKRPVRAARPLGWVYDQLRRAARSGGVSLRLDADGGQPAVPDLVRGG